MTSNKLDMKTLRKAREELIKNHKCTLDNKNSYGMCPYCLKVRIHPKAAEQIKKYLLR